MKNKKILRQPCPYCDDYLIVDVFHVKFNDVAVYDVECNSCYERQQITVKEANIIGFLDLNPNHLRGQEIFI